MRQLLNPPRRMWRPIAAIVAGAALFASGAFVANALDDDDGAGDDPATSVARTYTSPPVQGSIPGSGVNASMGFDKGAGASGSADSALTRPWGGCQVPIPGVLSDGKVDPSAAGVDARFLGSGFQLTGFGIRGETDCWSESPTGETMIVVDTQWKHADSGLSVSVSQRQDSKPMASVLEEISARFWKDGYAFWVNVDGYSVQPLAGARGEEPGFAPGPDPRAGDVLRAAMADLNAPAQACFYVAQNGSMDDLAGMGIGDPRGAIPSGFALLEISVRTWSNPDPGCNTPSEGLRTSFNASWNYTGTDRQFGALFASAYAVGPDEETFPGNFGEYGANWSNGRYHFSVGVKMEPPIEASMVEAIARALDPRFESACMAREKTLSEGELGALGINTPSIPDGYSLTRSYMATTELTGECTPEMRANFGENTRAEWSLRGPDGAVIDVRANKAPGMPPEEKATGFINENGLWWWTDAGVHYEVFGYVEGRNAFPPQETLIAIAKSLDPGLDVDRLQKGGGVAVPPSQPPVKDTAQAAGR